jgi:hypothetical protein
MVLLGAGAGTTLTFKAGCGIIIDYLDPSSGATAGSTAPDGGGGSGSRIRDLIVQCSKVALGAWANNQVYAAGATLYSPGEFRWYQQCVYGGTSAASIDNRPRARFQASSALAFHGWQNNHPYNVGDAMAPGTLVNQVFIPTYPDLWFECTTAGTSGSTSPSWTTTIDVLNATGDGSAKWTCRSIPRPWGQGKTYPAGALVFPTTGSVALVHMTNGGTSGGHEPSPCATSVGGTTMDNGMTWTARPVWPTLPDMTRTAATSTFYPKGAIVTSSTGFAQSPPLYYECTNAGGGVSGASAPSWPTSAGGTVVDGGVTWTAVVGASTIPDFNDIWVKDGSAIWAAKPGAGVWLRGSAFLDNVFVNNATGAGILVQADSNPQAIPPTEANGWGANACFVQNSGLGLAIIGGDTNNASVVGCSFSTNTNWAVWDDSFLGCSFFSCLATSNGAGFNSDNPNASVAFVGCYCEGDQRPSNLTFTGAIWIGGVSYFTPGGLGLRIMQGSISPTFVTPNLITTTDLVNFSAGDLSTGNVAFGVSSSAEQISGGNLWRLHHGLYPSAWWSLNNAGSPSECAFRFADMSTSYPGSMWFPNVRTFFNSNANSIQWTSASPTTSANQVGDIAINTAPGAGKPAGWICITAGSPGTWRTFGVTAGADANGTGQELAVVATITAGVGGSADDVTIIPANTYPNGYKVTQVELGVVNTIAGASLTMRDATSGGGNVLSSALSASTAVRVESNYSYFPTVATGSPLVARRSDNRIGGYLRVAIQIL